MYTTVLILLSWPLVLTALATWVLGSRLRRPGLYFVLGLTSCLAIELALFSGLLPIVVGLHPSGFLVQIALGAGALYGLYRRDRAIVE